MEHTARFLEQALGCDGGYRFAVGCPKTLLATCFGVLAQETLGALPGLPAQRRRELIESISSCQQPDGTFRDPQHGDSIVLNLRKFTPTYLSWQETYFALHALDALDAEPPQRLSFIEPFTSDSVVMPWLGTLGFDDFWFASNYVMFLLYFLIEAEGSSSPAAHRVLDWLDKRQDPKTGYWGTQQGASLFNGMAGAFHVYGFYQYLGRPIFHQSAAVASTLKLQESTGLWSAPGGGSCEDLDAIDILAKLEADGSRQEREVRDALARALPALRASRRPDGGYCWTSPQRRAKHRQVVYSGLSTLRVDSNQSDAWSTWFRPLAIALAQERLGQEPAWPVRYRSRPLLGWHPTPDHNKAKPGYLERARVLVDDVTLGSSPPKDHF